jgi:hypothetical protein
MSFLSDLEWELILDTLARISWPLVAVLAIFIFKQPLRELIDRLREIDWSKKLFRFGDAPSDKKELLEESEKAAQTVTEKVEKELAAEKDSAPTTPFHWDKAASLYWLGNDMMWVQDMMYRNAPPERVYQGMEHVKEYAERVGLWDLIKDHFEPTMTVIGMLKGRTDPENYLVFYRDAAKVVNTTKFIVSVFAEKQESDFVKLRAL